MIKRMAVPGTALSLDEASIRTFGQEISFDMKNRFIYLKNRDCLL
jgi:hypothetical protein